uniref:NADH dehydrogenase subunit 3 n=1 Tax=Limassolla lingchuanensis TaxID=2704520 RepID=UPI0013E90064|nr:NADH dehydrogenase subunit 3 [Limassolla lingchuanensis]QHR79700.1 NADH dehydrogenase subunit 3 [Limassolla lingchuanensis]
MYLTMISLIMIIMISFIIVMLINLMSKKPISDSQKSTPFECGFNPLTMKRLPFSIHFFLIAVIFLIFDIEIIIILPMTLTLKTSTMYTWMTTSSMFIIILIMGLYHEWKYGMLNWTK